LQEYGLPNANPESIFALSKKFDKNEEVNIFENYFFKAVEEIY
jgi:hypothetical protein